MADSFQRRLCVLSLEFITFAGADMRGSTSTLYLLFSLLKVLYDPDCLLDQEGSGSYKTHKARLCCRVSVPKDLAPSVAAGGPVTCVSVFPTPRSGSIPG